MYSCLLCGTDVCNVIKVLPLILYMIYAGPDFSLAAESVDANNSGAVQEAQPQQGRFQNADYLHSKPHWKGTV